MVKAFNTVSHTAMTTRAFPTGMPRSSTLGDDDEAKRIVAELISEIGLTPEECGPLANARLLEVVGLSACMPGPCSRERYWRSVPGPPPLRWRVTDRERRGPLISSRMPVKSAGWLALWRGPGCRFWKIGTVPSAVSPSISRSREPTMKSTCECCVVDPVMSELPPCSSTRPPRCRRGKPRPMARWHEAFSSRSVL